MADHSDNVRTSTRPVDGAGAILRGTGLLLLALLTALALAGSAWAQAPVGLGTADSFAVLGGSAVTNTGPSVINGDLGVSPGASVTGFPPGTVNGTIHAADAVAAQAQSDLTVAYNDAAGRACEVILTGQDLGGLTLTSGVYCFAASAALTGTLTLNAEGDPNAVFIFQIGSTLITASNSNVALINGAQACNVFWQVGSSATLGTTTTFVGNILALTSITANTGATVDGRLLARNGAVTLDNNTVSRAECADDGGGDGGGGGGDGGGGDGGGDGGGGDGGGDGGGGDGGGGDGGGDGGGGDGGGDGGGGDGGGGDGGGGDGGGGDGGGGGPGGPGGDGGGGGRGGDDNGPDVDIDGAPGDGISGNPVQGGGGAKKRCLGRDFRLQIIARDRSGIRTVKVFVDGRRIKKAGSGRFFVWIDAERLGAGSHRVVVVARDRAGNRTVKNRRFTRCARPSIPTFTG